MDREANLPVPPASTNNQPRMIEADSGLSRPLPSTSSSSSPPDFVRHVQAALKRHRPLGIMQSHSLRPRRILVPQREPSKSSSSNVGLVLQTEKPKDVASSKQVHPEDELIEQRESVVAVVEEAPEDSSLTPPSITGTITQDDNLNLLGLHRDGNKADVNCKNNDAISSLSGASPHLPGLDGTKKVQFSLGSNAVSQRADERMATRMDNLSSHLSALALTEMECNVSNRVDISTVNDHDPKQQELQHSEMVDMALSSDGGISSLLAKRSALMQDQQHQFMTFLGKDIGNPMTQSSVLGSTCATTTSVHSTSVPMLNSTTYNSCCHPDSGYHMDVDHLEEFNVNPRSITQRDPVRPSCPTNQCTSGMVADPYAIPTQPSISATETPSGVNDHSLPKGQHDHVLMEGEKLRDGIADHGQCNFKIDDKSAKGEAFSGVVPNIQFQAQSTRSSSSNVKLEPSKSEKSEKAGFGKGASVPRKRNHDPDLFFKVNGKLYQKLGKIGSGGSSEVYKVISANCMIYALKKIKLKGRDYATAYGFCQEIEYLNKLKGKNNIIQLIDYEVTDKTLLEEVMNGSMNIKDGRIKVDGFLYMVLEYGEIDLAHMLSQKWKEMESSSWNMDENWLRFYWQQILQAVNTIHEERIVHSDLKPANFLLVKGSLKLIDFGIAKAIMSDTTNIQRDSQVGTLSYMSPEAFLCNENDANGNTIKCGRPSDIWSLGCILYQMVYGRTPFAEYKTFWAKFKVITDRTHEITYGPVSNPWLLDLMKNCLAWERKDRWRIPQLLQHPFLVPPIQSQLSLPQDQSYRLLQLMAEAYVNDHEASRLCSQLQQLLTDPVPLITSQLSTRDQHCKLLSQMFRLCYQLQQHLTNLGKEGQDSSM